MFSPQLTGRSGDTSLAGPVASGGRQSPGHKWSWWIFTCNNASGSNHFYYFNVSNCYKYNLILDSLIFEAWTKKYRGKMILLLWLCCKYRDIFPLPLWSPCICIMQTLVYWPFSRYICVSWLLAPLILSLESSLYWTSWHDSSNLFIPTWYFLYPTHIH